MYLLGDHLKKSGFFGSPCIIAERNEYHPLPSSARLMLFYLYQVAHRLSSPRFLATESTLARAFGLDPKTIRVSLLALQRVDLLRKTPGKTGSSPSEIWLTNPETSSPFPVPEDLPIRTFKGFSKPETHRVTAEPERTLKAVRTQMEKTETLETPRYALRDSFPSTSEKEPSSVAPRASEPEILCNIPSHRTIHYRRDGSPVCGDCHPTRITESQPRNIFQPTARELFGEEDVSPGVEFP